MDLPSYVLIKCKTAFLSWVLRGQRTVCWQVLHTSCQPPYLCHHFALRDDELSGLTLLLGCSSRPFMSALLSQSHLLLPSEAHFRYPSFFTLHSLFFIPMAFFFPFVLHLFAISILLPLSSALYLAFIRLLAFQPAFFFFYHT